MLNKGMFSSLTGEWETPADFFAMLDAEFRFTLDVCARPENAKCARFFSPEQNGLAQSWAGKVCWMNPPYGREIGKWRIAAAQNNRGLPAPGAHGYPLVAPICYAGHGDQV